MKHLTPKQREMRDLFNEASKLTEKISPTKQDELRHSFLLAKLKSLNASPDAVIGEENRAFFGKFLRNKEVRATMEAGSQTLGYTQGQLGGYTVPQEFNDSIVLGMAQYDPLLNGDIVSLKQSADFSLRPFTIPGWDASTFTAVKVAESIQQTGQTPPTVSTTILNGYKYKASLPVSMELEEDAFESTLSLMGTMYSIGFARGIGVDLITGNGTTAPQGVVNGAGSSVYTTATYGLVVYSDINSVYFAVNRFHRASPKCAWLMNDVAYEQVANAVDGNGRPLINIVEDQEMLKGKPVYISPSLPASGAGSFCIFGDLSHVYVRLSQMILTRNWQLPGYVEKGQALYTGYMRADAKVFDPTAGNTQPIVAATLHS